MHLLQFLHQVALGVEAASGVHEKVTCAARLRGSDGVVRDRGGVGVVSTGDDLDFQARAPELELLDGSGTEGVAGGENDGLPLPLQQVRELRGGGGLARAVDADDGDDGEFANVVAERGVGGGKAALNFRRGDGEDVEAAAALRFVGLLHGGENLLGHRHAEVGGEEGVLQLLDGLAGEFRRTGDDPFEFVAELGGGLVQASLDFGEQSHEA